jgi:tRNA dimethylallyltransferase
MRTYNCIAVIGPTASGKTRLACQLAHHLNGEIISADSRQVYKGLNIGTGKDLGEYSVNGKPVPHHLIDIAEPEEQFYLHQFMAGLKTTFNEIHLKNRLPIICGGTGLYLDALRKDFSFTQIKENETIRQELETLSKDELVLRLEKYPADFTAHVDRDSIKRIIRGIEIAEARLEHPVKQDNDPLPYRPYYIGIKSDAARRRELIRDRLLRRMDEGLIDEVNGLLQQGISHQRLEFFGLEYKFVSYYLQDKITKEILIEQLHTAISQFAKRQMTWFRKMEKEGVEIHWIDAEADLTIIVGQLEQIFGKRPGEP